jgi:hypothetical protein
MALTFPEWKFETGPDSNSFTARTLTYDTPVAVGNRAVVAVVLYTTTGVDALAGMISDDGEHTWVQDAGLDGDGNTGGVAILSTVATTPITDVTLTPGGSGNYATWGIGRASGPCDVDSAQTGSGSSTAPAPTSTLTAATTDGVAVSVISTRSQSGNQTPPATWTLVVGQPDNSTDLAGAVAHSANISSAGNVASTWATDTSAPWYFAGVVYKASAGPTAVFIPPERRQRTILRRQ